MQQISPGMWHWTAMHPGMGLKVSSYFLRRERVLIDPIVPEEGLSWFDDCPPEHVLLNNRHHDRQVWQFQDRFGCHIRCGHSAVTELQERGRVEGFAFGDQLPGDIVAMEVGAIFPDEAALHIPRHRAITCGDGVIRPSRSTELSFVPDQYLPDPVKTKLALRAAYRALLEINFDVLLLAHGHPIVGDGKAALESFANPYPFPP